VSQLLQLIFSGLTVGATYALAALGFSIIYNASGVINFAQGEFIMLGGMIAAFLSAAGVPLLIARPPWRLSCWSACWLKSSPSSRRAMRTSPRSSSSPSACR